MSALFQQQNKNRNMKKLKLSISVLVVFCGLTISSKAQEIPVIEDRETAILKPLRLDGPRIGFTYVPEIEKFNLAEKFNDSSLVPSPFITQFGWQFEWKYFETRGGSAGLFEVIPLIGGLDQGLVLPSLNFLTGFRSSDGFEIGGGPNFNLLGSGFTLAIGHTIASEHMNFPVNLALTKSRDGTRFTLLFGFTKRRRS